MQDFLTHTFLLTYLFNVLQPYLFKHVSQLFSMYQWILLLDLLRPRTIRTSTPIIFIAFGEY